MSEVNPAQNPEPSEAPAEGPLLYQQPEEPEAVEPTEEAARGEEEPAESPPTETPEGEEPKPEEDGEPVSTLPELLEASEIDAEWFDTLKVPVKVDGQSAEATVKELVANFQMGQAAEKRLEDAKAKAKQANEEMARQAESLQSQFNLAAKLIAKAEEAFNVDTEAVDWDHLRTEDPAEFSAKKQEFAERQQRIQQMKADAANEISAAVSQQQEQSREQLQQFVQQENEKLLEAIPDWRDAEKATTEKAKLAEYLIGQGFTQEDVMNASDHRLILVARKAMLFDEAQAKSDAPRKKVVKAQKVLKPGAKAKTEQKAQPKDRAEVLYG